jgi:hypothetical protein
MPGVINMGEQHPGRTLAIRPQFAQRVRCRYLKRKLQFAGGTTRNSRASRFMFGCVTPRDF